MKKNSKTKRHFTLDKGQIEITHEYKHHRIYFYLHGFFESLSERQINALRIALMGTWRKGVVGVSYWELKSHVFKGLVLPTFQLSHMALYFGKAIEKLSLEVFEKGMKIHMMSHIEVCSLITYHIELAKFKELPIGLLCSCAQQGFPTMACPPTLLLVSQSNNLIFPTPCQTRI